MGSKYPRSLRGCLPLWALVLEGALILAFFFFTSYDTSSKDQLLRTYTVFQDVAVMAALGLGFLSSSLRRHGWSSVAFSLFLLALGVQWALLLDGFLDQSFIGKVVIRLSSVQRAAMSAMSVLISAGAVLGKVNLVQLVLMVLLEVTAFGAMRMVSKQILQVEDHVSMMHVHVFAAYFGLIVAWCLSRPLPKGAEEKDQTATSPSLFAMLGTLFLWMFWPSFNSALLNLPKEKKNAVFNTYYALAVSAVTAISMSTLAHPQGKINMTHIHNAVLAGGVAAGPPCHLIQSPWIAMVLGLLAGLISVGGAKCLPDQLPDAHRHWGTQLGLGHGLGVWSPDSSLIWLLDFRQNHPRKTRSVCKQDHSFHHSHLPVYVTNACYNQDSLCTMMIQDQR
ncbi:PREDICTED: blood group Rh(CE) polypeptide isoform X4 [Condylura cristata]|uniref:blood group Rh(CE) polypeptide isoform X4 n=1 Tax=Condylura cristata TaxID=143302 RepID=UPI0006433490|nr:PREDICTED: blood group Rh(CE) polypeptide isoform X4 [Condylura cristata]